MQLLNVTSTLMTVSEAQLEQSQKDSNAVET